MNDKKIFTVMYCGLYPSVEYQGSSATKAYILYKSYEAQGLPMELWVNNTLLWAKQIHVN